MLKRITENLIFHFPTDGALAFYKELNPMASAQTQKNPFVIFFFICNVPPFPVDTSNLPWRLERGRLQVVSNIDQG